MPGGSAGHPLLTSTLAAGRTNYSLGRLVLLLILPMLSIEKLSKIFDSMPERYYSILCRQPCTTTT